MSFTLGNVVRISAEFRDYAGTLADPTTVKVKIRAPRAAASTFSTATRDSAGKYHLDVAASVSGRWVYRFEGSGSIIAATEGEFFVDSTAPAGMAEEVQP